MGKPTNFVDFKVRNVCQNDILKEQLVSHFQLQVQIRFGYGTISSSKVHFLWSFNAIRTRARFRIGGTRYQFSFLSSHMGLLLLYSQENAIYSFHERTIKNVGQKIKARSKESA